LFPSAIPCKILRAAFFLIDIKIQIDRDNHYVYPDISLVFGNIEYAENRADPLKII